jgi:hypothetical protein
MLGAAVLTMVESRACMKNAVATSQIRPRYCAVPTVEDGSYAAEESLWEEE